ncbi:hypothetical protein [Catenuloplanes indicus]|uniref:CHAT domain-containing protein n=1 Tax=Catenuloplanes indicus TaxID=137267 RepID=A0AAE4AVI6_9ACTN|nr:hypothetical protein [Catenuloplanes indicus]MDQ0364950.1 hypothetical protein [Catenuloplanes indicus]
MQDTTTASLRAELAGLTGAERVRPLLQLGQQLMNDYWRSGPGQPGALPYLNQAIEVVSEACEHLETGDAHRGSAVAMLGVARAMRGLAHAGPPADCDTGVVLLEEALSAGTLPPGLRMMSRMTLGQLYLTRAVRGSATGDDAGRAAACFRAVRTENLVQAEMRAAAETMLELAEALQAVRGGPGGPAGLDFARITRMMSALQDMQDRMRAGTSAFGTMPSFLDADDLARQDPLDRPVPFVEVEVEVEVDAPAAEPERAAAPAPDAHPLALALTGATDVFAAAAMLLSPQPPPASIADIDDLAGLAATAVYTADPADPADLLLLAAALHTRARHDDADPDDPDGDHRVAGRHLLEALEALPPGHPAAVTVLGCLGAFLDGEPPLGGLAGRFADRADAIIAAGATDAAAPVLRAVCRACGGGDPVSPESVPDTLPWAARAREVMRAAGRTRARLGGAAPADIAAALRRLRVDGLAGPDGLFLHAADGRLLASWPPDWRRALIIDGTDTAPPPGVVVSYLASTDRVPALLDRDTPPVSAHPVFVANPRGDRDAASVDTMILRRLFHPRSVGFGRTAEHSAGAGTPAEVAAHLDASLLHLGCDADDDGLRLAGPATLGTAEIRAHGGRAGGVAILPASAGAACARLAGALLDGGFAGVVGWSRPVPATAESLALFMLHLKLVDGGLPPADAVHDVRGWLADTARTAPAHLPAGYAPALRDPATAGAADSLRYWGR